MMRFVLIVFLFLADVSFAQLATRIDDLRNLCIRETSFDFCGKTDCVVTGFIGHTDRELEALASCGRDRYNDRMEFQKLLETWESSILADNANEMTRARRDLDRFLTIQKGKADVIDGGWLFFYRCIERTLYSLARISEIKHSTSEQEIMTLLSDGLLVPPSKRIYYSDYWINKAFRNLLVIGCRIRAFKERTQRFPINIAELKLSPLLMRPSGKMILHYAANRAGWHLYYERQDIKAKVPFNVYVPTLNLGERSKWPCEGRVDYSSDFSSKRFHSYLFQDVLNEAAPAWKCRLINGRFEKCPEESPSPSDKELTCSEGIVETVLIGAAHGEKSCHQH